MEPTQQSTQPPAEPKGQPSENTFSCTLPHQYYDPDYQESWERVLSYCDLIMKAKADYKLSSILIAVVILKESNGFPDSISKDGAVGLMQVMPRDGLAYDKYPGQFASRPTVEELLDPAFNIDTGSGILAKKINDLGLREGIKSYGPKNYGYLYADAIIFAYEQMRK